MQTSFARPVVLVLMVVLLGVALVGGAPAVGAQASPSPCRLLTPREIAKRINEKVGAGTPDSIVPGNCVYPFADATPISTPGTEPFVRSFDVAVLDRAKCGSTKSSPDMLPARVGTKIGIYDTTGVLRVGRITVHTVQLWVVTHGHCLNVSWDRRPGPLPSGSEATRARRALVTLGRLAIRRM